MENIKRITILENDTIHENCPLPYVLGDFVEKYEGEVSFTVWEWFNQDVIQNKEKCVERLKELSLDSEHVFLTNPSFIGYDNTFSGWTYFLSQLSTLGIKLKLYVIYGNGDESLLAYCLNHIQDQKGYGERGKEVVKKLKEAIAGHEIYYSQYDDTTMSIYHDEDVLSKFKGLTLSELENNIYKRNEIVRIKSTGENRRIVYTYYGKSLEKSHVDVVVNEEGDKLYDEGKREYDPKDYQEFKLTEIEKV